LPLLLKLKGSFTTTFNFRSRGLELSEEKTRIRNVEDGFDFLGCNIRSCLGNYNVIVKGRVANKIYGNKLIIKPSKLSVKKYKEKLDTLFNESRGSSTLVLIKKLNPVIRGWVNYFKPYCSRKTFEGLDSYLYIKQYRYAKRTHANKGLKWIVNKYFGNLNLSKPNDH
jgi:RNA-directed DNA polymerase